MTGIKKIKKQAKYCIIHGHFYQPPRENPWSGVIETQPSAAPYHDWNERIYDECYRPNAYSRILDSKGMILDIHNNYSYLSFNFGPTLFQWLEEKHPEVVNKILDADKASAQRLEGHGNAIAQVYNHIIMPLASRRDKITQIRWGKSFFKSRFGRDAQGMWLAETAINMETVLCLIEEGIKFVILSPTQADAIRVRDSDSQWNSVAHNSIDTRFPYRLFPYSKKGVREDGYLDVFFFDRQLSQEASFGNLLTHAELLADRISSLYTDTISEPQTVTIATDGETFGHHKPFADMCLAFFFAHSAPSKGIKPVNCGYFLAHNPPRFEVSIKDAFGEGTSWSCAHGVGRWIRDCGCNTGAENSWNQQWRTPLRKALDTLQSSIDNEYQHYLKSLHIDPWKLRDQYEPYYAHYSKHKLFDLISRHCTSSTQRDILAHDEKKLGHIEKLLQAQKYTLFSYTSCAWFFADVSGIETIQNLLYAFRAIQLGLNQQITPTVMDTFLRILDTAKSNIQPHTAKTIIAQYATRIHHFHEILCFTACAHKTVFQQTCESYTMFNHTIEITKVLTLSHTPVVFDGFVVQVQVGKKDSSTNGLQYFSVLLGYQGKANFHSYILPFDVRKTNEINIWEIESWKSHSSMVYIDLSHIFSDSRELFATCIIDNITAEIFKKSDIWDNAYESSVESLIELNGKLPKSLLGALTYLLCTQWDEVIRQVEAGDYTEEQFTKLRSLKRKADNAGVEIDFSKTKLIIQKLLYNEMEHFTHNLSPEPSDRIRYLLNIVDRFSIPIQKSCLEDRFYELFCTSINKLYQEYRQLTQPSAEQKTIMIQVLNFARRMNFSTDNYLIDSNSSSN